MLNIFRNLNVHKLISLIYCRNNTYFAAVYICIFRFLTRCSERFDADTHNIAAAYEIAVRCNSYVFLTVKFFYFKAVPCRPCFFACACIEQSYFIETESRRQIVSLRVHNAEITIVVYEFGIHIHFVRIKIKYKFIFGTVFRLYRQRLSVRLFTICIQQIAFCFSVKASYLPHMRVIISAAAYAERNVIYITV